MLEDFDIEDEKFNALLQDRRHKELTAVLKTIVACLSGKTDREVVDAIKGQPAIFKAEMEQVIKSLPKVVVNVDYENVLTSIKEISDAAVLKIEDSNNKVIEVLETRLLPDTFDLIKNYGATQSVKVNYKPANLINTPKPKYQL